MLYDPDRSQTVAYLGEISSWGQFLVELRRALAGLRNRQGAGLRLLTETVTSPTLADQLKGFLNEFPQAVWHSWEPAGRDNARAGRHTHPVQMRTLAVAELEIDPAARSVRRAGREVTLTSKEYLLLELLARRAGQVVTRTEIMDQVWTCTTTL